MINNFIRRANYVAWVYFWTFVVSFFANQYFFFGFCLSISCIAAAMPPVGIFSVGVGTLVNHALGWGKLSHKNAKTEIKSVETDIKRPIKGNASVEAQEIPLSHKITQKLDSFNEGMEQFNVSFKEKSENFNLKLAVNVGLNRFHLEKKSVQSCMEIAEKLTADPSFADIYYELGPLYEDENGHGKKQTNDEPSEIAEYSFPEEYKTAPDAEELRAKIEEVKIAHITFLKMIHDKIAHDSTLRHHFEQMMKPKDAKLFDYIMQLGAQGKAEEPDKAIRVGQTRLIIQTKPKRVVAPLPMAPATPKRRTRPDETLGRSVAVNGSDIEKFTSELGLPHLVHFTRCENLRSILQHGLQSVAQCEALGLKAICNDELRLDDRLDGTSLSFAFPNYKMFYKYRQISPNSEWAVLLLSPRVLWEKQCRFYTHNAADARSRHHHAQKANSLPKLKEIFSDTSGERPGFLKAYDPTDPQAEVMVFEGIEPSFIETISFETRQSADRWRSTVDGRDVICAGVGEGLFGTRDRVRTN